jgi:chemotaxis protein MotB
MDFLLSLDFNNHENLKELILASGRSFLDPIYTEDGKEDSDASRRIEIKLRLKNEEAIKEIGKLLQ